MIRLTFMGVHFSAATLWHPTVVKVQQNYCPDNPAFDVWVRIADNNNVWLQEYSKGHSLEDANILADLISRFFSYVKENNLKEALIDDWMRLAGYAI